MRLPTVPMFVLIVATSTAGAGGYPPPDGYVPNAETAIRIAVAVWEPIYGAARIAGEKPYRATLKEGVWFVEGTLPRGAIGGTAEASIAQQDGRVLRVSHGQ